MLIALAILFLLLGAALMLAAPIMLAVRKAVRSFLDGFPRQIQTMMAESDPKMKKSLAMLEKLPRISIAVGGGGLLLFLLGVYLLHNPIAQGVVLSLGILLALAVFTFRDKLVPLLKKQLMDQMQKQAAKQPPMTPQQIRKNMQDARSKAARPTAAPVNRAQRREAQRRKQ